VVDALKRLREEQREKVEAGIAEAQQELVALEKRRQELEELIAGARAWLGEDEVGELEPETQGERRVGYTLHEAMELVLREHPEGMRAPDLARMIDSRRLYKGREGKAAGPHQIHARVYNYPKLFTRENRLILAERSLPRVRENLDKLREVAREAYEKYETDRDGWTLDDYLEGIDQLDQAIAATEALPSGTRERWEAEKRARNGFAQPLYFRGRLRLATGGLGFFPGKRGDKGVDWDATELSRAADQLAAAPLLEIYRVTAKEAGIQ
jgi:hypothetical protein